MFYDLKQHEARGSDLKALIIYDDLASALKANNLLRNTLHRTGVRFDWEINLWRLNMLRFESVANEALREATDADLIVFAIRHTHSLPMWLIKWLEQWATLRQILDATLAVIRDVDAKATLAQATFDLSQFARRYGLSIIGDDRHVINDERARSRPNSNESKSPALSTQPEFRRGTKYGCYRLWLRVYPAVRWLRECQRWVAGSDEQLQKGPGISVQRTAGAFSFDLQN
jgi:hypothetical protein